MRRLILPRRQVLGGLGAAAGLAACGQPSGERREAGRIGTVVLCMMENRSFDHVFGSLSLLEGRDEVDGLVDGMTNPDVDGNPVGIERIGEMCTEPDPPHGWDSSRTQFDGGTNQGFVRAYQESRGLGSPVQNPMSYLTRAEQPISYALADGSTLYQRWFSAVLTSTWPNRIYFHASQSQGQSSNDLPGGPFSCRTIWDQLTEAGIDWAYYFTDLPTLALFGRPEWAGHLFLIDQFYRDAEAGALPSVVCVDPGANYNDDHPPHHPLLGQMFLGSIYAALAASPQWGESLFLYTYDEAGGFHDHVPPGTAPDDLADQGFDQLGFRVPAIMTGPFVRPGVSDLVCEHSAALTLIQNLFGIDERLTARNAAAADLREAIDWLAVAENRPADPIPLPAIERSAAEVEEECRRAGHHVGQPELQAFVRERFPHLDHTRDLPRTARQLWRRAEELGLWIPV
ncbi:MAG: phosphoesterase [Alphaproteobacteria bacterium]|nr:phosphoesterase [Alphaproteobacteria bacterium]